MNYSGLTTNELESMVNHGLRRIGEMVREGTKSRTQAQEEIRTDLHPIMKEITRRRTVAKAA